MFNDRRFAKFSLCIYDKMLNIKKDFHSVENVSRDRDIVDYGYAVENVNKISHAVPAEMRTGFITAFSKYRQADKLSKGQYRFMNIRVPTSHSSFHNHYPLFRTCYIVWFLPNVKCSMIFNFFTFDLGR